jgi:hypothetical protein
MGSKRTLPSGRALFAISVLGSAFLFLLLGRIAGENIALELQKTPTTTEGWLLMGWLVGGPPYLVAVIFWNEHGRFRSREVRLATALIGVWIGMTMFIAPARVLGVDTQFGTGAIVGNPLSAGWVWGAVANAGMAVFSTIVLLVMRSATASHGGPTDDQRRMTARFLEAAWLVTLVVTLGLALYGGNGSGIFNNGT